MKNSILLFLTLFSLNIGFAQNSKYNSGTAQIYKNNLPVIQITKDVNLHFRIPEPVQFVDLSTDRLIGDLPTENVVRIKIQQLQEESTVKITKRLVEEDNKKKKGVPNTVIDTVETTKDVIIPYADNQELGVVTIVGQSFMAQYKIVYRDVAYSHGVMTNIEISPNDMQPLEYPSYDLSNMELKKFAMDLITKKPQKKIRKEKELKMISQLNNVYTMGDYVFLDVSFFNKSNLSYDIDELKFTIDDKKIYKSTNVQSIEIEPIYQLYHNKKFKRSYRNIYVFKKFTYPNNKVLNIRLVEDQVSGRTITLGVKYSDILQADTF